MLKLLALNTLTSTDRVFFIILALIVVIIIAIYFLIPVFNKKQYQEQRENLKKREEAFKTNAQIQPTEQPAKSVETTDKK